MHGHIATGFAAYNLPLLALAVLLAGASAYAGSLTFARSRAASGAPSLGWLATGAAMIALSIWVLHFVAMLAMDPGVPVRFDPLYLTWSAGVILVLCGAGYLLMRRSRSHAHMLIGSAVVVTGSFLMHQIAMLGYHVPASMSWVWPVLGLAWLAAFAITGLSTTLYRVAPGRMRSLVAPACVVVATLALHFIAMAGTRFTPLAAAEGPPSGISEFWLAAIIALMTALAAGGVAIVAAFDMLMTRQKRQEGLRVAALAEQLKKANADAELARRAKAEFLGAMSHELRTPLNGVLGMGAVLGATALDDSQKQMLDVIDESARALERVISDVLDLSQADSGDLKIQPGPFNARELTEACVAIYRDRAQQKGLKLAARFDPGLAETYIGDARRIRQVLGNLVSNAVKFTDEGGVMIQVSAQTSEVDSRRAALSFAVIDTGIGVALADQPNIFQAFRQADNSNARRHGGTGLGLAIADHLARLMGGRITVDSEAGKGATFRFQVAAGVAESGAETVAADQPRWSLASRMAVLVIDNDPTDQVLLRGMLERLGASVTMVEDADEAHELLGAQMFDLIVFDAPSMGGAMALRRLRKAETGTGRRRTPVLVCASDTRPHIASDFTRSGADSVLEKPLDVERFFAEVEELCEADTTLTLLNSGGFAAAQ